MCKTYRYLCVDFALEWDFVEGGLSVSAGGELTFGYVNDFPRVSRLITDAHIKYRPSSSVICREVAVTMFGGQTVFVGLSLELCHENDSSKFWFWWALSLCVEVKRFRESSTLYSNNHATYLHCNREWTTSTSNRHRPSSVDGLLRWSTQ